MKKQLVPVPCATGLILAGLVGCKKENLLNPNGGVSNQMLTQTNGGKILKSGGGDYDEIAEYYPEINEGEDTMILKSFYRDYNRYYNDSGEQNISDREETKAKFLMEAFLNYIYVYTEDPLKNFEFDTLDYQIEYSDYETYTLDATSLWYIFNEMREDIETIAGDNEVRSINLIGLEGTSVYRGFRMAVAIGQINENGYCEIPEELGTGSTTYCPVLLGGCTSYPVLHESITSNLNCLEELQYNKNEYIAGNVAYSSEDVIYPWLNIPNTNDCYGPSGRLWYSQDGTVSPINNAAANSYLDGAYATYLEEKVNIENQGYYVWLNLVYGSHGGSNTIEPESNCFLQGFTKVCNNQGFEKFIRYRIPHTFSL